MRLICQICDEFIGELSIEGKTGIAPLRFPITGAMIGSSDPFHGVEPPFEASTVWAGRDATLPSHCCPYGRTHLPFIEEDLIKTHKGMVRLPKDGRLPYMDDNPPPEVKREDVGDKVNMISDEDAEKIARDGNGEQALIVESKNPIPPLHLYEVGVPNESGFICAACGKKFDTANKMASHARMAHKVKK